VLTLADAGILDEKGQLADGPDQLVDVLSMQEKARRKAQRAATKTAKPLWEEDGKVRGLLDKYDEEEEEAAAAFDAGGQLQAQRRREEELRKRLAAGKALLDPASGGGGVPASSDYYTAEEAAAMKGGGKEKKKKKRKLRTTKVSADEDVEAAAGLDLDALEAAAAADGAADLGSREAREQRRTDGEAARAAAQADRAARFEAALGRANIASEALRPGMAAAAAADEGSDEADDELAVSLARARRLAQKAAGGSGSDVAAAAGGSNAAAADGGDGGSSFEGIAKQLAKKREEDEAKLREQIASGVSELDFQVEEGRSRGWMES
jgi:U4/U6.U5 tri-snRNP-associated protein 1